MGRSELLPFDPKMTILRINVSERWFYWWNIKLFGASDRANRVWDRTTRLAPKLETLDNKSISVFRLFLEWESATSIAKEKKYAELFDSIDYHYEGLFFKEAGLKDKEDMEEINLIYLKYAPLNKLARYLVNRRDKFDSLDIQDQIQSRVTTALEMFAREFPDQQNVV